MFNWLKKKKKHTHNIPCSFNSHKTYIYKCSCCGHITILHEENNYLYHLNCPYWTKKNTNPKMLLINNNKQLLLDTCGLCGHTMTDKGHNGKVTWIVTSKPNYIFKSYYEAKRFCIDQNIDLKDIEQKEL